MPPLRGRPYGSDGYGVGALLRSVREYFDWHPVTAGVVLAVATAVGVSIGLRVLAALVPIADGWAICTPLNGVVLAMLLMGRRRLWLWILIGYIAALWQGAALVGAPHRMGAVEIFGNLLELLIAAFTLPPFRNFKQWLLEPRLLGAYAGYGILLGPAVMAIAVAGRVGTIGELHAGFWERVRIVGFAEALGVALGTSLVLILANRETYRLFRWRVLPETLGLLGLLGLATWFAFTQSVYPVLFLPYAILVAIAFRQGLRGAVLGTAVACSIVSALAVHARGPLAAGAGHAVLEQSYLALALLMALPLGVTLFKRKELEEQMKYSQGELDRLKSLDRLTGVANRKRFDLVLVREWKRATRDPKPVALLMVDVDYFALYNECYGPQAGDECLRSIAMKMADQPHRPYDLVSRYEGGRFSVLLPGATGEAVKRIAEEFRAEIAAMEWPHELSQFGQVTVSVGWASMMPEVNLQPEVLIAAAEQALSGAKAKGRNRVEGFSASAVAITPVLV